MSVIVWLLLGILVSNAQFSRTSGWAPPSSSIRQNGPNNGRTDALRMTETNDNVEARQNFLESMKGFHQGVIVQSSRSASSVSSSSDPMKGYTAEELEAYATQQQQSSNSDAREALEKGAVEEQDDEDDAMYLNAELYINSRDRINPDGTIQHSLEQSSDDDNIIYATIDKKYHDALQSYVETVPMAPESSEVASSSSNYGLPANPTINDLWNVVHHLNANPSKYKQRTEETHKAIFAQEEGHLQQTELFRQSLTDPSKADQAAVQRRGRRFRERQQKAIEALERQIQEFETTNNRMTDQKTKALHCSKCRCVLSEDELAAEESQRRQKGYSNSPRQILCRVCYTEVLVASNKLTEREAAMRQQQRARRLRRSMRRPTQQKRVVASRASSTGTASTTLNSVLSSSSSSRRQPRQQQQRRPVVHSSKAAALPSKPGPAGASAAQVPSSPWVEVVDPDTKEVWYWNEDTEEMRWEL